MLSRRRLAALVQAISRTARRARFRLAALHPGADMPGDAVDEGADVWHMEAAGRPRMVITPGCSISPAPATILSVTGSATRIMPCGWIEPGTWIGSRSQAATDPPCGPVSGGKPVVTRPGIADPIQPEAKMRSMFVTEAIQTVL